MWIVRNDLRDPRSRRWLISSAATLRDLETSLQLGPHWHLRCGRGGRLLPPHVPLREALSARGFEGGDVELTVALRAPLKGGGEV